ncbi:hypothetical protein BHE74_00030453 [Ensete ventricosum]|nr:hypothetical protein BHE74_00030453 [Ensete ventricosum]RZS07875.1 hypothetical protein BHM03_00038781 [Ensete ventricosum]
MKHNMEELSRKCVKTVEDEMVHEQIRSYFKSFFCNLCRERYVGGVDEEVVAGPAVSGGVEQDGGGGGARGSTARGEEGVGGTVLRVSRHKERRGHLDSHLLPSLFLPSLSIYISV